MRRLAISLLALGAIALPGAVIAASHRAADHLGGRLGALAALYAERLKPAPAPPVSVPIEPAAPPPIAAETSTEPLRAKKTRAHKGRPPAAVPRGVRVSAARILELAQRGAAPGATPVGATALHPPGLRLTGVSGLGVGMHDGDVLTRVAGVPVHSVSSVANLVIRARGQGLREISAEFWRDGTRWHLVVEQPYLPAAAPPSGPLAQGSLRP
ncbi:MAG TPA: hypothetical protein VIM73_12795 [Polyangiaceae bacterium]